MRSVWWVLCALACPVHALGAEAYSGSESVVSASSEETPSERSAREVLESEFAANRAATAATYAECLKSENERWIGPDYERCDAARDAYVSYVPEDSAMLMVGCLEERAVGAARNEGATCEALTQAHTREVVIGPRWP